MSHNNRLSLDVVEQRVCESRHEKQMDNLAHTDVIFLAKAGQ